CDVSHYAESRLGRAASSRPAGAFLRPGGDYSRRWSATVYVALSQRFARNPLDFRAAYDGLNRAQRLPEPVGERRSAPFVRTLFELMAPSPITSAGSSATSDPSVTGAALAATPRATVRDWIQ